MHRLRGGYVPQQDIAMPSEEEVRTTRISAFRTPLRAAGSWSEGQPLGCLQEEVVEGQRPEDGSSRMALGYKAFFGVF